MRKYLRLFGASIFLLVSIGAFSMSGDNRKILPEPKEEGLELVFILDRSGSMGGLEKDTIGGFNSMLEKQKNEKNGKVNVTTVLFDNEYEILHNKILIKEVVPITEKEYYVRGSTALLDAIGKTIAEVKADQNKIDSNKRYKKVMFIIITDGMENASKEYTVRAVKDMIETQKNKEKWEFLFLGANIDAIGTAESFGIERSRAVQYKSDSVGTMKNYEVLNEVIKDVRNSGEIKENWQMEIEEDVKKRGK